MAFKLNNPPYVATAPVHEIDMEDGVLGKADKNGNILINKNIKDPKQRQEVINHEQIHINSGFKERWFKNKHLTQIGLKISHLLYI